MYDYEFLCEDVIGVLEYIYGFMVSMEVVKMEKKPTAVKGWIWEGMGRSGTHKVSSVHGPTAAQSSCSDTYVRVS